MQNHIFINITEKLLMKKIYKNKIINIDNQRFDQKFLFHSISNIQSSEEIEIFHMSELLQQYKNEDLYNNLNGKFAMYSEVYSPKDELKIFEELFEYAISQNKKIHIVGITLKEELEILEKYYTESWFLRQDVNCFIPDFSKTLVTVWVNIENLMWKGSDYKAQKKNIFFVPPIRESWQNKAMFKGINRGSIASIFIKHFWENEKNFLQKMIQEEKILPLTLGKILKYNLQEIGFSWEEQELIIEY